MPEVAIYTRISQADPTEQTATHRQERACRAYAEARDWTVTDVYEDVDRSAYTGAPRPAYERMVESIAEGSVGGVLVWKLDRLMRRSAEFERFWQVCEAAGATLASVTEPLDSSTELGRAVIRVLVTFAALESATKAERLKAKFAEMARAGSPPRMNLAAYGFDRTWTVVPREADVIRELARRYIAGETAQTIAIDLNARGVPAPRGGQWLGVSVTALLRNPRIVGDRQYRGEVVARDAWAPIVDRVTFETLAAMLKRRGRINPVNKGRHYLLTGVIYCEQCGRRMSGAYRGKRTHTSIYRCFRSTTGGCDGTSTVGEPLDAWVSDNVLEYLNSEGLRLAIADERRGLLKAAPSPAFAELTTRLERLADDHYRYRTVGETQYLELRAYLRAQLEEAEETLWRPSRLAALTKYASRGRGLRRRWPNLPLEERRDVVFSAIERITVGPWGRGNWTTERFSVVWRLPITPFPPAGSPPIGGRRNRRPDIWYAQFAADYVALRGSPSQARDLGRQRDLTARQISGYLYEARWRGLLTSPGRGKGRSEVTEKAVAILARTNSGPRE